MEFIGIMLELGWTVTIWKPETANYHVTCERFDAQFNVTSRTLMGALRAAHMQVETYGQTGT